MRLSIRLLWLLGLAFAPVLAVTFYNELSLRQARMAELERTALNQANLVAAALNQLTDTLTRNLATLEGLTAQTTPTRWDGGECQQRLHALQSAWPHAVEVGVRRAPDQVVCAVSAAGRATRPTALPQAARAAGTSNHLELAWPLPPDNPASPAWTAYARLDLAPWGDELLSQMLMGDAQLLITDQSGRVLLAYPAQSHQPERLPDDWRPRLHAATRGSLAHADWFEAGPRTIGFVPVTQSPHGVFIAVGLDPAPALAAIDHASARTLVMTALALLWAGLATWGFGQFSIAGPLGRILATLQAWQRGDQAARARTEGSSEFAQIGQGLDALLNRLQARDMQHVQTEQALHASRDAAMAASAAKTRFMASASHDLRQPLHALTLTVAALANQLPHADAPQQKLMTRLKRGVATLTELVEALLDLSRLDAGQIQPELTAVALDPLLNSVAEEFRPLAEAQGLTLAVAECPLTAHTDRALLGTMLRNMVANAIKFTPAGGRVDLSARLGAQDIEIAVRDTGIGIPPERHAEIFEEFRQLGNPERRPGQGLGLGLNIVKRLSDLLNHPVTVDSRLGAGATFTLRVPAAPTPSTQPPRGA